MTHMSAGSDDKFATIAVLRMKCQTDLQSHAILPYAKTHRPNGVCLAMLSVAVKLVLTSVATQFATHLAQEATQPDGLALLQSIGKCTTHRLPIKAVATFLVTKFDGSTCEQKVHAFANLPNIIDIFAEACRTLFVRLMPIAYTFGINPT